jgi:tRNA(fMet)-specific endonuclease VapC
MFILDTDHFAVLQAKTQPEFDRLAPRIASQPSTAFYLTIVSFHEEVLGWNTYISRARDQSGVTRGYRRHQRIIADFAAAQLLPFDLSAAARFDLLRAQRVRVPTMDLRIASIALQRDMTALTRNTVDFRQVPGLRVEDWTL